MSVEYTKYEKWVTRSWLKTLCEKANEFYAVIDFHDVPIGAPRDGDKMLMPDLERKGFSGNDVCRLNRVRIHS